ncbi:hypothetical protein ACFWNN_16165 [Lentzea sp. NPDC058450]|uniref:hypothetical protein n=1 Tax=Lentzea sp. NPDC058450 TaxID=3346505 RepID=UPI0036627E44
MLEKFDLEVYEWSVRTLRRAAGIRRFRSSLGEALHFLSCKLAEEGRHEEALAAAEESAALLREQLPHRPRQVGARYVNVLQLQAALLHLLDWHTRAADVGSEVLRIERRLDGRLDRGQRLAQAERDYELYRRAADMAD